MDLVRTDVSEELSASFIGVTRTRNNASVVRSSPILVTPMKEALSSSETSVLTRATRLTSQKTPFFIVTAVKTSNLTYAKFIWLQIMNHGLNRRVNGYSRGKVYKRVVKRY
jgi:hypothetical protein